MPHTMERKIERRQCSNDTIWQTFQDSVLIIFLLQLVSKNLNFLGKTRNQGLNSTSETKTYCLLSAFKDILESGMILIHIHEKPSPIFLTCRIRFIKHKTSEISLDQIRKQGRNWRSLIFFKGFRRWVSWKYQYNCFLKQSIC